MENPNFLKIKYNLHNTPEVESAARRTEVREDEKLSQNPAERIQNYLDRLKVIFEEENPEKRERGTEFVKNLLHKKFVIKQEEIPEAYFDNQRQIAREQGHGDIEITPEMRAQLSEVIIADQTSSLDSWVDYLGSQDATYPDWLKYWAFRSALGMGKYDKEKKQFAKRELKKTVAPFPDINREALAYVLDAIEKKSAKRQIDFENLGEDEKVEFGKLLQSENFAKLYAFAIEKVTPASQEQITITEGKWVKYDQGSDHLPLVQSLQSHGTGWCTAGESTAQVQLKNGDFWVYYSLDENKTPRIPRAAIRMEGDRIGEVRGIAEQQNLDPYIGDIVQEKLAQFPDGKAYEKKNADMKLLTEIEKKTKAKKELSKEELIFLYEIDSTIDGFGYQRDPRIKEILDTRKSEEDAMIIFQCSQNQIAKNPNEVNESTKAYIGPWSVEIFQKIKAYSNIEHLYQSFPDKKIFLQTIKTIPTLDSPPKVQEALDKENIYTSDWGKDSLQKTEFSKESKEYDLVRFSVAQLGFPNGATTDEIYKKAEDLGLELCPAEVGPLLRLQSKIKDWTLIAMEQVTDRGGGPHVFDLRSDGDQLELYGSNASSDEQWNGYNQFVFRFRKFAT